jgi:aminopeptidase N
VFAGYYRVNYDPANWNLIIDGLRENHNNIPPLNRAQLLDDALNLARAGKLSYSLALELTLYLEHDNDYIPWAAALNALSFLDRRLTNNEGYDYFKVQSQPRGTQITGNRLLCQQNFVQRCPVSVDPQNET